MKKEEILAKSRKEHRNRDLAEIETAAQAGSAAARVGAGMCCLISVLFVRAMHTVLFSPWIIYFSILGTHYLVKFSKARRKTDLAVAVLSASMFLLCFVLFVLRLLEVKG